MKNDSPINAKVIFKDGNKVIFYGNRYEKEDICLMVYNLRKMLLKFIHKIDTIQMFDNTIQGNKLIFEYKKEIVLMNNLKNYLFDNFNPKI